MVRRSSSSAQEMRGNQSLVDHALKRTGAQNFLQIVLAPNEMTSQSKREHRLIDVAPTPMLPRFNGAHQWMAGRMKVFCSVIVLCGVAASYVSANKTHPQVYQ